MAAYPIIVYAVDFNGDVQAGAKLFVYEAGTTTPVAIYDTAGLSTEDTNPAVCDSAGRLVAWVDDADGPFKVILRNAAESQTYFSQDNVDFSSAVAPYLFIYPWQLNGDAVLNSLVLDGVTIDPTGAVVGQAMGFPTSTTSMVPYTPAGGGDTLKAANETITGRWAFNGGMDVDGMSAANLKDLREQLNIVGHWYTPEMFGAAGNGDGEGGGTNDATALQNALNAINTAGGGTLWLINRYRCDSGLTVYSNTRIAAANPGAGIDGHNFSAVGAFFTAAGSVSNITALTATATKGAYSVSVASGAEAPFASVTGHAVGALVRVYSDDLWYNDGAGGTGGTDVFAGEINFVRSTSDGSITLLYPLRDTYTTSPKIELVTPVENVIFDGGTYLGGDLPSTNNAREFTRITYGQGIFYNEVTLKRVDAAGFQFAGCQNVWVSRCRVEDMRSSVGYGVSCSNSQDVFVDRYWSIRCRHATSCASDSSVGHRGPSRNFKLTNFIAVASAPAYSGDTETSAGDCIDFHANIDGALVANGTVIGSSGAGVLVEGPNVTLANLELIDCGTNGVIADNKARRDGYFRATNVSIRGWSRGSTSWQAVEFQYGSDTVSGTFTEATWRGGTIEKTGGASDGQNVFRSRRLNGTNTCGLVVFEPDFISGDGMSNIAIQINRADRVVMSLSGHTNTAGSNAIQIDNCGTVEIVFRNFDAQSATSNGMIFSGCTSVSLTGRCDFSDAGVDGIDFGDTGHVSTDNNFDCTLTDVTADGIAMDGGGTSTFLFGGFVFGTGVGGDIIDIDNTRVFWTAEVVGSAAETIARLDDCDNSELISGGIRRTATQFTSCQISDSDNVAVSSAWRCDMSSVSGGTPAAYVLYIQRSDKVRFSGNIRGSDQVRLLTIDECDGFKLSGASIVGATSTTGVQIDADCNDAFISDDTTISGASALVADSGAGTIYNLPQPYAVWTAANIANVSSGVNTSNKYAGRIVRDSTNKRLMQASGAAAADAWYTLDAAATVTPS